MKRNLLIIIVIIIVVLICFLFFFGDKIVYDLFDMQYNMETGVSSIINISLDNNQTKEKIGILDGYDIYVEGLKIDECYFTTIDAKTISLIEAINNKKVSIEDMTRKAFYNKKEDNKIIYYYENYIIVVSDKEVIIKGKRFK